MKRTLFLSVLFGMLLTTAHAENESHQQVESTLYAYYRWCNNNIRDTAVLSKADTLFRLSGEKHDIRMQAVALSLKADHYYFNNNLDSLKAWIPRVQDFARKNDQIKYYYFTWSRLILYYTKQAQYTLAQYELEQYMSQAEKDNYKPATAEAYKQLGHIYRTRGLKKPAVEYYRKAIDFIIQNGLNTFHLSNLYSELATMLMDLQRYPEAAEAVEKGKACIPLPDYIWGLKAKETHLLAQTGQTDKAKALFNEIKAGQNGNLSEIKLAEIEVAIYNHSHEYGKMIAAIDKLIRSFEREGYKEFRYYSPKMGMYVSQDPIGLAGNNPTLYGYVQDTNSWIDIFGLSGRGGDVHRNIQNQLEEDLGRLRGSNNVKAEGQIILSNNESRFGDVIVRDPVTGKITEVHQIGDMRSRGGFRPSSRERGAIMDIREALGDDVKIVFHDKKSRVTLINPDKADDWQTPNKRYRKLKGGCH